MSNLKYTNIILTVIAVLLFLHLLSPSSLITSATADDMYRSYVPKGVIDVNIVDINTYDKLPVEIKGINTSDNLDVDIENIDTYDVMKVEMK